jgi:hypothetical protein
MGIKFKLPPGDEKGLQYSITPKLHYSIKLWMMQNNLSPLWG